MKIIDLLHKIANGEEVPKKICYLPYETNNEYAGNYTYKDDDYLKDGWNNVWLFNEKLFHTLNDEIEIIEEPKKIEKIQQYYYVSNDIENIDETLFNNLCSIIENQRTQEDKLNEIIDYINKGVE